jgi:hypothetical protein
VTAPVRLTTSPPLATAEEAAAVMAAVERFRRDTAPSPTAAPAAGATPRLSAWQRAALLEGVSRQPERP